MRIDDQIDIAAPARLVWALTERIDDWPDFVPTIEAVERLDPGEPAVGSRVRLKQPGQPEATWTVTRFEPPERFEWQRPFLGVTMTASHLVEPLGDSSSRNTLSVELAGRWARMVALLVGRGIRLALAAENQAFKQRAEAPG